MQYPSWTANHSLARGTTAQSGAWEPASGWQCCDAKSCNLDNMNYADCDSPWTGICPHRRTLGPGLWLVSARQCWTVIGWVRTLRELRRGVTFILQELRSPGGLIVRFIAWILQKMRNVKRRWTKEIKYGAEKKEPSNVTIANISKLRLPPLGSHHLAWPHWSRPNHQVVTRERQN